ncbi:MAG: head maturation protease, ClpP-related [Oscillospiraceae bacterium]
MKIDIKGAIIPNDDAFCYKSFGMDYACPRLVQNAISQCKHNEVLDVYINSGGGSVFAGLEIYNTLKNYSNVKIHIVGLAGSIASVIAMSGDCEMSQVSQMMVHNVSSLAYGDYREMDKSSQMLQTACDTIAMAYVLKSGLSKEEVRTMMDNETWLTPQKALELHLIDSIAEYKENSSKDININNLVASSYQNMIPQAIIDRMNLERQKAMLNLLKLRGDVK